MSRAEGEKPAHTGRLHVWGEREGCPGWDWILPTVVRGKGGNQHWEGQRLAQNARAGSRDTRPDPRHWGLLCVASTLLKPNEGWLPQGRANSINLPLARNPPLCFPSLLWISLEDFPSSSSLGPYSTLICLSKLFIYLFQFHCEGRMQDHESQPK